MALLYKSIHTARGLQLMADAEAFGVPIKLATIAVGDGNGNPVTLADVTEDKTALIREVLRAPIARVYTDPNDPLLRYAEISIGADVGGFVIREVMIYTDAGEPYVYGNYPQTWKPVDSEGAFGDSVIKIAFRVSNAEQVTLFVDPSAVMVTQAWIDANVNLCRIAPGGTTGQVLTKQSNGCGDAAWQDVGDIGLTVDTIEEKQTLADAQTVVTWTDVNATGLAVYIEGIRIAQGAGVDGWEPDPLDLTKITLGRSYPAGTAILGVQNDPNGGLNGILRAANNLSDVDDAAAARGNLDVFSKAETIQRAPPSAVMAFARNTAPAGWLKANGAAVSRTAYADLFAAIGTTFGAGDGATTFNLPDLRGQFVRGWDDARGLDAGRSFGSAQKASILYGDNKRNTVNTLSNVGTNRLAMGWDAVSASSYVGAQAAYGNRAGNGDITDAHIGGARPTNVALLYCIKF